MRTFRVIVSGNEYEVAIEEITENITAPAARKAAPAQTPAAAAQPAARAQAAIAVKASPMIQTGEGTILAPMPGTITEVKVCQGDTVERGDTLLILEAMKMQNEIKAPFAGIVSAVEVTKGAAVNAGMALMVLA